MAPPQASAKNGGPPKEGSAAAPENPCRRQNQGRAAKEVKGESGSAKEAAVPQTRSKGAQILALIGRAKGATLAEMRKTTGWQAHSVCGFLSTAAKKHNLQIESTTEGGDRLYRVQK